MDNFFYWSGVVAWGVLGATGTLALADRFVEWVLEGINAKREFLAFVWDRAKKRRRA